MAANSEPSTNMWIF